MLSSKLFLEELVAHVEDSRSVFGVFKGYPQLISGNPRTVFLGPCSVLPCYQQQSFEVALQGKPQQNLGVAAIGFRSCTW